MPRVRKQEIDALAEWEPAAIGDVVRRHGLGKLFVDAGVGERCQDLFGEDPAAFVHLGDVRHAGPLHLDAAGHGVYVIDGSLRVDGPFAFYAHDAYTVLVVTGDLTARDLVAGHDSQLVVLGKTQLEGLLYLEPSDAGFARFRGPVTARERLVLGSGVEGQVGFAKAPKGLERSVDRSGAVDVEPDRWSPALGKRGAPELTQVFAALVQGTEVFAPRAAPVKPKAKGKGVSPKDLAKLSVREFLQVVTGFESAQIDGAINPNYLRKGRPGQPLASLHIMSGVVVDFPDLPELRELKLLSYSDAAAMASMLASLPKLTGLRTLRLVGLPHAACPAVVGALAGLEVLELRDNGFTTLPRELGDLSELRTLELVDNGLTTLPVELLKLEKLERLVVREERLRWPKDLAKLRALAVER